MTYKEFYIDYRSRILENIMINKTSMYLSNRRFFNNNMNLRTPATYDDVLNEILIDREELYNEFINFFLMREIRKYFKQKQKLKIILEKINLFDNQNKLCYDIRSNVVQLHHLYKIQMMDF